MGPESRSTLLLSITTQTQCTKISTEQIVELGDSNLRC